MIESSDAEPADDTSHDLYRNRAEIDWQASAPARSTRSSEGSDSWAAGKTIMIMDFKTSLRIALPMRISTCVGPASR